MKGACDGDQARWRQDQGDAAGRGCGAHRRASRGLWVVGQQLNHDERRCRLGLRAGTDSRELLAEDRPGELRHTVDNPYWPLEPGTTYHYEGVRGTTPQTDDEVVTHQKKQILGVACTVVRDIVSEHGQPVERTFDWYAQDKQGNVWYMGEDSFELQQGRFVRASDSWEAGVKGGKPGIIMPGDPQPGDAYRQEYYRPGEALDQARVLTLDGRPPSPTAAGTPGCWSPASGARSSPKPRRSTTHPGSARSRRRSSRATTRCSASSP